MKLFHGDLSCDTILLDDRGRIQIGEKLSSPAHVSASDIQKQKLESVLRAERSSATHEREDLQGLGSIMIELMEPSTHDMDPKSQALRHPEKWDGREGIVRFLNDTATLQLEKLRSFSTY